MASRVRVACNECKQRKLKCDRSIPACGNCAKADRSCIIEDPSTKRNLPPGYTAVLEERVAYLERLLKDVCPEMQVALDHMTPVSPASFPGNPSSEGRVIGSPARSRLQSHWQSAASVENGQHESSQYSGASQSTGSHAVHGHAGIVQDTTANGTSLELDRLRKDIEVLCVNSAVGQPQYLGPSSALGLSKIISSALGRIRLQGPGLTMGGQDNEFLRDLPRSEPASLPDRIFGSFLSEAYFTHVHPQYPFLHQPTFTEWENNVYYALENAMQPDLMQLFFVNMVYAVGAAIRPAQSPCPAASLYAAAEILFETVMKKSDYQFVQALLLCAMYSMRSSVGVSVWMLSGMAVRHCIELGLHRKITWTEGNTDMDALTMEMQRRVFWVSYNIDRASAMTLGRPISVHDGDINVDLPLDINDDEINNNGLTHEPRKSDDEPARMMSPSLHFIQLRRIWARIQSLDTENWMEQARPNVTTSKHYETAQEIDRQLREWFEKAPVDSTASATLFSGRAWVSLSYHHSILLLHRRRLILGSNPNYNFPPDLNAHPVIVQSHLKCAESAAQICRLYREIYFTNTVSFTWGALHVLFLAGLTFLHSLWTSKEVREACRRDVVTTCTSCTIVLVVMGERWSVAQPYRDMFNLLAEATQAMLTESTDTGGEHRIWQLPVMRRSDHMSIPGLLNGISGVGVDRSAEMLLNDMVE